MVADHGPFPQEALAANQIGRLTDTQRRNLRALARGVRGSELRVAAFLLAFGIFLFVAISPGHELARIGIPFGCALLAAFLIVRAVTGGDALTRDLRRVQVQSVDGAINKWSYGPPGASASPTYHLGVAGQKFQVSASAYAAAPDAGIVRIYFLPSSRTVVNLEHLPDRPLPADALTNPLGVVQGLAGAMRSHDPTAIAEAHATMASLEHAVKAKLTQAAVPPPVGSRNPRPLADAIVGTWSSFLMTVTFTPDGRVTATMPGGHQQSVHWSVDPNGHLVADAMGHDEAVEAWVEGDQLTITMQGMGLPFTRQSTG